MDRITAAKVFIEITEQGSFTKAAAKLNMSTAMVSRYLSELEQWFGTRLMHRTTRVISLTEAGTATLPACRKMLMAVAEAKNLVIEQTKKAKGVLRVATSGSFADAYLVSALVEFQKLHPEIEISLSVGHTISNLVEDRIDLAVRVTNTLDPTMIAVPLTLCNSVLCAAPEYLEKYGSPTSLEELSEHRCVAHFSGSRKNYRFIKGEDIIEVPVKRYFESNETNVITRAVLSGAGVGMLPTFYVGKHLKSGKLVRILPQFQPEPLGIYAIYLSRHHQPLSLRLLVEFLKLQFKDAAAPWDHELGVIPSGVENKKEP